MSDQAPSISAASYDSWAMTCARAPSSPSSSRPDPTPQVNLPATSFFASNWVFGETHMRNPVPDMFKCFWDSDSDEDWELESVLAKTLTTEELERKARAKEYWDMDMKDWHDEIFFNWADEPRPVRAAARPSINPRAPAFVPSRSPSPTGSPINPQAPEFIPSRSASLMGTAINPQAPEFVPSRSASPAINPQAPEFIPSRTGSPTSNPINPLATPFFPSPPAMEAGFSAPLHTINHVHPTFTTTGTNWRSALAPPPHGAARPAPALRAYIRNPPFSFHDDPRMDSSGRLRSSRPPTRESVRALNESWGRALAANEAAAVARAAEMIGTQAAEDDSAMVDVEAEAANAGAADLQIGDGAFALPPPEQMVWRFNRAGPLGEVLREAEPREVAQRPVVTYRDVQAYLERRAYVAQQERPDRWFNAASRAEMRGWIQEVRVERERKSVGKKRKIMDEER